MPKLKTLSSLLTMACAVLVSAFVGCSYPTEVINANQAVESARQAGKDKLCPDDFRAAERLKDEAYALCRSCDTTKAIALAKEAIDKANGLCPPRVVAEARPAPAPAPVQPPAPAPTLSLSASPASLQQGQCATLTWSSANASSVSIDQGVGKVDLNGSRQVCPDRTTQYRIAALGAGGSREASATVAVAARVVDRLTLHVNFDFNKATVRKPDDADLQKAIDFVKKYSGYQISLIGYTDSIGSDAYNQALSEKRADTVKGYLAAHGVDAARIQASGRGESDPVGDNSTEQGRFQNRRVEIVVLSE